jgi:hypothetical protein
MSLVDDNYLGRRVTIVDIDHLTGDSARQGACYVQQVMAKPAQVRAAPPARDIVQRRRQSSLWTSVHRLESTMRCLGIKVDGALEISEQTEI